ncbi:hypothetical protein Pmani_022058 [Petrolisthes manimaculis]|uniref:Uncharacterized protein n=1 Tax=Petrolisthes manimaculis TaxID=1843537 RepID=A0AAE1U121_9EUCA|nr:hypothetical protein Pmani_022058 [Petrolisthes manimaculis]
MWSVVGVGGGGWSVVIMMRSNVECGGCGWSVRVKRPAVWIVSLKTSTSPFMAKQLTAPSTSTSTSPPTPQQDPILHHLCHPPTYE